MGTGKLRMQYTDGLLSCVSISNKIFNKNRFVSFKNNFYLFFFIIFFSKLGKINIVIRFFILNRCIKP